MTVPNKRGISMKLGELSPRCGVFWAWQHSPVRVKIDVTVGMDGICKRFPASDGPIRLDFRQYTADTVGNTLAAPLLRQVKCLRNDVHQGRVIFLRLSKLEGPR